MLGGAGPGGEVPPASSQLLTQEQAPSLRTPPGGGRRVPRRITAQRPPPHTHTHTRTAPALRPPSPPQRKGATPAGSGREKGEEGRDAVHRAGTRG